MENTNLNINGKEIKKEDIDKAMQMFKEKFGDLDGNSIPDILDSLEKKGIQGKMLASIAKSYLKNNNISTETIVTVVENKVSNLEQELSNKNHPNNSIVSSITSDNIPTQVSSNKIINPSTPNQNIPGPSKNFNLNPSNSPFATILVYLIIAGVLTAVIYFVKISFGF